MKLFKLLLMMLIFLIICTSCGKDDKTIRDNSNEIIKNKNKTDNDKDSKAKNNKQEIDFIKEKVVSMTIEEKIGQLIIAGFEGKEINESIKDLIENKKIGGFILFQRNIETPENTLKLLNDLKLLNSMNDYPLFLSIDEEGGRVSRLPKEYQALPSSMEIGSQSIQMSYDLGVILGKRVKSLGFNIDFAPVLDIFSNPNNTVIGNRAFGITPEAVKNKAIGAMKGIRDTGIIPAAKHFPGHGDTDIDSHFHLPTINKDKEELDDFELIPFKEAIKENVEMMMIAHILYPKIDKNYPASMSNIIINEILRGELNYNGVVVSDDMTMGAIVDNYGIEEGTIEFLKSGGDIALICHGTENTINVIEKIKEELDNGKLSIHEIDKKVYRILKLKEKYNLKDEVIKDLNLKNLNIETEGFLNNIN